LRPNNYSIPAGEKPLDFRAPVDDKLMIRGMLFGGFKRCLYPAERFQSDSERRFAVMLENDTSVVKWFKPGRTDFQIHYKGDERYEPDFVVETTDQKLICEIKARDAMNDPEIRSKADAASVWCGYATAHAAQHGGKPWSYLLIPHDAVDDAKTLQGLAAGFTRTLDIVK
jgi:type III restriction enzyme